MSITMTACHAMKNAAPGTGPKRSITMTVTWFISSTVPQWATVVGPRNETASRRVGSHSCRCAGRTAG